MADYPQPAAPAGQPPITAALVVYALFAIAAIGAVVSSGLVTFAPLVVIAGIVGVIIAYVKRGDVGLGDLPRRARLPRVQGQPAGAALTRSPGRARARRQRPSLSSSAAR